MEVIKTAIDKDEEERVELPENKCSKRPRIVYAGIMKEYKDKGINAHGLKDAPER